MRRTDLFQKSRGYRGNILFTFQVIDGFLQLCHRPFSKLCSGLSLGVKGKMGKNNKNLGPPRHYHLSQPSVLPPFLIPCLRRSLVGTVGLEVIRTGRTLTSLASPPAV